MARAKPTDLSPLHYLFSFLMMLTLAGILTFAQILQYAGGEIPCPLCLLQRVAMLGVCFGLILDLRETPSLRNAGLSMIFALLLLVISVRQVLLDIYPRPGHEYIGSAIFGLHMPVWSVLIAAAMLLAFALKFAVLGGIEKITPLRKFPALELAAKILTYYVVALCALNFVSAVLQCGVDACHTYEYRLLK
jgi:disulfide bond formation protein DsbB